MLGTVLAAAALLAAPSAKAPPEPAVPPPPRGQVALAAIAGTSGAVAITFNLWNSISGSYYIHDEARQEDECLDWCFDLGAFIDTAILDGMVTYPFAALSIGTLGGAMFQYGKLDARADLFGTKRSTRWRPRKALGWSLFGGGTALFGLTRLGWLMYARGRDGERTEQAALWIKEVGFLGSMAMGAMGIAIAGHASGYARFKRKHGRVENLSLSPMFGGGVRGLALSGRF